MITQTIKEIIESNTIGSVATISESGFPQVSPKGTFIVYDKYTLAFSNLRSANTIKNIAVNPSVEILFSDVFHRTGCRVAGQATYYLPTDEASKPYQEVISGKWPTLSHLMKGYVVIAVERASLIKSPSYDIGLTREGLEEYWLKHYNEMFGG